MWKLQTRASDRILLCSMLLIFANYCTSAIYISKFLYFIDRSSVQTIIYYMHYVYSRAHSTFWGSLAGSSSLLWLPLQEGVRCWVSSRVVPSCWTIHTSNSWPWLLTQFHGGEFGCHGLSNLCKCMRACNCFKLWCQDIFVFPCIYNYIYTFANLGIV